MGYFVVIKGTPKLLKAPIMACRDRFRDSGKGRSTLLSRYQVGSSSLLAGSTDRRSPIACMTRNTVPNSGLPSARSAL